MSFFYSLVLRPYPRLTQTREFNLYSTIVTIPGAFQTQDTSSDTASLLNITFHPRENVIGVKFFL